MVVNYQSLAAAGGIFLLFFILLFFIAFVVAILAFVFWILMLVDVAKREFKNSNDKIVWILVVILAGVIGAIVYYFIVKTKDKAKKARKK